MGLPVGGFPEAEAYDGPALIIAYSHCIAHGINTATTMQNQKAAVQCGQRLLYRYNHVPQRARIRSNGFFASPDEGRRIPGS